MQDSATANSATATVIGLIAGYMIHRHWQELEWLVRMLFG
jgi:hypothetical protein